MEETWVKTALRTVEWKNWWNPLDAERKLVSLHWTEDTVEETWVNTGGHDNPLAMNVDRSLFRGWHGGLGQPAALFSLRLRESLQHVESLKRHHGKYVPHRTDCRSAHR